jgi:hypothetical protein
MSAAVDRLAVEAGKYHGLTAGETIDRREVVLQAEANGYTEREAFDLLEGQGDTMEIPEQGNLFGELWPGNQDLGINSSTGGNSDSPAPCTNDTQTLVESFRGWLEDKEPISSKYYPDHAYSRKSERAKYAKAKDCDRAVQSRWPTFSTVSIVVNPSTDQSPSEQAQSLYTDDVRKARRKVLKDLGVWGDYAGLRLKAPRPTSTGGKSPETHGHILLWLPGRNYSREDFRPILEAHPVDQDREAIQIQGHISENVETPENVLQRGSELDSERGDTTALPHEAAMNLPMVKHDAYEARKCPDYVEEWYALMKGGRDDDPTTRGLRRTQALGRFNEYAQAAKLARESSTGEKSIALPEQAGQVLRQAVAQFARMPDLPRPHGASLKLSESAG